jgi:8-oxo-dGTP diphosphatase
MPQTVVGAIIVDGGRVLAARRTSPPELAGQWEFPGGKVEPGEDPHDALVREVAEELGARIAVGAELTNDGAAWPISDKYELRLFFATVVEGRPEAGSDHDHVTWLPTEELESIEWVATDRNAIRRLVKDQGPQRARRVSLGSWLGMAVAGIAGITGGALALVVTGFLLFDSEAGDWGGLVLLAALALGPATLLWVTGGRYRRAGAVGLAASFVITVLVVFVWDPWSTMSDAEVERAKAEVLESGHPAYYLGDAVAGYDLNSYYLGDDQASFSYGSCHLGPEASEGGCIGWDVSIHNSWRQVTIGGDAIAGCVRLAPVAGVPTVHLYDDQLGIDKVVLFTGRSEVNVEFGARPSLEDTLEVAREVRQVGESAPATSLPPPTPRILAYVEKNCGPTP